MKVPSCTFILSFLLSFSIIGYGQTIERSVVGSAGQLAKSGGIEISATAGESAVTTASQTTLIITQGFQQTYKKKPTEPVDTNDNTGLAEASKTSIVLYPNPTHDQVFIKGLEEQGYDLTVIGFDGKVVHSASLTGTEESQSIPVSNWAVGTYYFEFRNTENDQLESFKVIKQ